MTLMELFWIKSEKWAIDSYPSPLLIVSPAAQDINSLEKPELRRWVRTRKNIIFMSKLIEVFFVNSR